MKKIMYLSMCLFLLACTTSGVSTVKKDEESKDSLKVNAQKNEKNQEEKESKIQAEEETVIEREECYCCGEPFEKGEGYFRYKEAGSWYLYEQRQDVFGVARGRYSCSRRCAEECPIRS